jgi:predicted lipoprotein with Yx(FWY)xxD motif
MKGKSTCSDKVSTETAGLMSPYPPGLILPDLDTRPSCTGLWPPVFAADGAGPVGKWSVLTRSDGRKQWAYEEQPLYTSALDHQPGDVNGGTSRTPVPSFAVQDRPAIRVPASPPPDVPAGFAVKTTAVGRLLTTDQNYSVYANDKDGPGKSQCVAECARIWLPVEAPATARAHGEWSVVERSPGLLQWAFRQQPLYTYLRDTREWSFQGSDVPGWRNVLTQKAPPPPRQFTPRDSLMGQVLADDRGMTLYVYTCIDDSIDQLSCENPDDTQAYRLAMCGGGDAELCARTWPYVVARKDHGNVNRPWSVMEIDAKTGRKAAHGQSGALSVWAFRDRPVYTYAGDLQAGDINGDGTGEWRGLRNGFRAFWLRDEYHNGSL